MKSFNLLVMGLSVGLSASAVAHSNNNINNNISSSDYNNNAEYVWNCKPFIKVGKT